MATQKDKAALIALRGVVKARNTRMRTFLEGLKVNPAKVSQVQVRAKDYEGVLAEFNTIQTQIEDLSLDESGEDERIEFEDAYFENMQECQGYLKQEPKSLPNTDDQRETARGGEAFGINLPDMNIPKFDGDYSRWISFRDMFVSVVDQHPTLPDVKKLYYLKSCLTGKAANVIDTVTTTFANYQVAWELLKKRYQNEKVLINTHVDGLLDLPQITKESSSALRNLGDCATKHFRALTSLGKPTDKWDTVLVRMLNRKLDHQTKKAWETKHINNTDPTFTEFIDFLSERAGILEALTHTTDEEEKSRKPVKSCVTTQISCPVCKREHFIQKCSIFLKQSLAERQETVKKQKLCWNCLRDTHSVANCFSSTCRHCQGRHHTLLHREKSNSEVNTVTTNSNKASTSNMVLTNINLNTQTVLLSTAKIMILGSKGEHHEARALLDSGSQSSFITKRFFDKLNLKSYQNNTVVAGVGGSVQQIKSITRITFKSILNNAKFEINCLIIPEITAKIPTLNFPIEYLNIPSELNLADPELNESSLVDVLLGADIFYHLLCIGQIRTGNRKPILQKTLLGWIVAGPMSSPHLNTSVCGLTTLEQLEHQVSKFWELDNLHDQEPLTKDELQCEALFKDSVHRTMEGRFIVGIPFRKEPLDLGDSYTSAVRRLQSIERKFTKNPDLEKGYKEFMEEYLDLRHMSKIENETPTSSGYSIPHHAVINPDSLTTKLRVVFDASARSSTNKNINEFQYKGPVLQEDLLNIILKFRTFQYVLAAGITKMYRQILVKREHQCYQQIVWRSAPNNSINAYQLHTLTYGMKSAPYLAIRCLHVLAEENMAKYPEAANAIKNNFYVDDLLIGHDHLPSLLQLRDEIISILQQGCFELRKWCSNNPNSLPQPNQKDISSFEINGNDTKKTLGIFWIPYMDTLRYNSYLPKTKELITKRTILSATAQIFDPLGLLAPVVIIPKLILQNLWQLKIEWDSSVPLDIHTTWTKFQRDLPILQNMKIPRNVLMKKSNHIQIHGFSDASEKGYGAAIYIRSGNESGQIQSRLFCAKGKVSPLKRINIPRLELCAALLLSQLYKRVKDTINVNISRVIFWVDSTIVLSWIYSDPRRWKTFVCNRTAEIQTLTENCEWRHVDSANNPADLISRGVLPSQLIHLSFWWNGPEWLPQDEACWPALKPNHINENDEEMLIVKTACPSTLIELDYTLLDKFSSLRKLQRVISYILWVKQLLKPHAERISTPISAEEMETALSKVIKLSQQKMFGKDLISLKQSGTVEKNSSLITLSPFLDIQGIIRVRGRLVNASVSYNYKHPIILSPKCNLTTLLISAYHQRYLHGGAQLILNTLRRKFWILSGKHAVKKVIRTCLQCYKTKPKPLQQIMGDLPEHRCQISAPFYNCGVDFGGPLSIIESHKRGKYKTIRKCYFAVFVCFSTKAAHIEIVSDLTSEAFIACLRRFTSRRGAINMLYSDNATNFSGACAEIKKLYQFYKDIDIQTYFGQTQITWKFIPPRAPHHGGLWEAAVKSIKTHLKRTVGETLLTFEELTTLLCQIESCLNSRPLTTLSCDPNDLNVLTPFHFLISHSPCNMPDPDLTEIKVSHLSRWQTLQCIRQNIWKRWKQEYLHTLQARTKWTHSSTTPLEVNDLVILMDDNTPPLQWTTARVTKLHPGKDNIVRVVTVKTGQGSYKRPITKVCLIPQQI